MEPSTWCRKNTTAFFILAVLICLIYSNSLDCAFQFDDFHSIVHNPKITIGDLYPETLKNTLYAASNGGEYRGLSLYRPIPMFSFAMNWYFGRGDVTGFHCVNIVIHILTAVLIFLNIKTLYKTPALPARTREDIYHIALLTAAFWAVHPIQIQAVTYIVQRMAAMAALFYLCGTFFYLRMRLAETLRKKIRFLGLTLLSFLAAIASKENAVTFPVAIGLIEMAFFYQPSERGAGIYKKVGLVAVLLLAAWAVALSVLQGSIQSLLDGYNIRSFTLVERLMTQPRVLCLYLYQFVYPVASQFSIDHSIAVSKGLFTPWTTLPAILLIVTLVTFGLASLRRLPLVGFGLLFFFLNHAVESSFLPLELVFEHRNYLPTAFLFLPVFDRFGAFVKTRVSSGRGLSAGGAALTVSLLLWALGMGTYARNFDWHTAESLWTAAIANAAENARPYQNLAVDYYQRNTNLDLALDLQRKAIPLWDSKPDMARMVSFVNICKIYMKQRNWERAIYYGELAVDAFRADFVLKNYLKALIGGGEIDKAAQILENSFSSSELVSIQNIKTMVYLKQGRVAPAWASALKALKKTSSDGTTFSLAGYVALAKENFRQADYFFEKASVFFQPAHQVILALARIEAAARGGLEGKKTKLAGELVRMYSCDQIQNAISEVENERVPILEFKNDLTKRAISDAFAALGSLIEKPDEMVKNQG